MGKADHRPSAVAAPDAWRRGLDELRDLEAERADDEHAWYWRVRARVLGYMVSRYADAPPKAPAPSAGPPPPLTPPTMPIPARLDPDAVEEIRTHVHQIASANLEVDKTPPALDLPRRYAPMAAPRKPLSRRQVVLLWLFAWLPLLVAAATTYAVVVAVPQWLQGRSVLAFALIGASGFMTAILLATPLVVAVDRMQHRRRSR